MKKIITIAYLFTCLFATSQSITVSTNQYTVPQLVNNVLFGNSTTNCANGNITNVSWRTGSNYNDVNGIGYFTNTNPNFPFSSGVILSTGNAVFAAGPNNSTLSNGSSLWTGDSDLYNYINGLGIDPGLLNFNNASVIEFDFQPYSSQFAFDFLFVSEEYGTFQCTFSDAFAFFLKDITAGTPPVNLALVPNTSTPISVVTVRDSQYNSSCNSVNPQYFANYYSQTFQSTSPINFNGQTTALTAASSVDPTHTYHIKLVIADRNDNSYDSAVFLKAGSFSSGIGNLIVNNQNSISTYQRCPNEVVTLQTGTVTIPNVTYTWYQNGAALPAITSTTLAATEAGIYSLVLSGANGCTISSNTLTITDTPFGPISEPLNLTSVTGIFDLTSNIPELLNLVSNPNDYNVTFYEGGSNGINYNGLINNPTQYAGVNNQLIYALIDNTNCNQIKSFILNPTTGPSNDPCIGAINLTVGGVFNDFPVTATNSGATNEPFFPQSFCDGNFTARDVWYSLQVPNSGNVTIETQGNGGLTDTVLEAFSSCTSPVSLGCNNDNNPNTNRLTTGNLFSKLVLTDLTPGQTIFVRAFGKSESMGSFSIAAYDSSLGQQQWNSNGFQIAPNPVQDILQITNSEHIHSLQVHSLLGQKLLQINPSSNSFELDFSNFQSGIYLITLVTDSGSKTVKVIKN
ncbi:choice-of-anchor L domain-containing protein [Flavobacterium stagni]|uniref:T9SS type A sorting domain-containing protein n=1 Tax=Flavobacterium stagni TaxID=2506421 RepID=A0A4Q1K838_9FLAO|nr:choice-of-anchor L domain-containing protein [Flavobacterium stagni]RXR21831.1 T9SS type A sorting domain-containing protein [Flavobacterium stagni]